MLRRLFGLGRKNEGNEKKAKQECFSLEFCRIDAVIPPDDELMVHHIARDEMIFKCSSDLEKSSPVQITYHPLKPRGTTEVFTTSVSVIEKGQLSDTRFLYKAKFIDVQDKALNKFFKYLKEVETTQLAELVDYHDRRAHYRLNRILPVVSRELKGYKGLTKNISCGGIQITCGGGIKKGDVINLRLELDDYHSDPIPLCGEVCWVVEDDVDGVRVGIRFNEIPENQRDILEKYIDDLRKRA